MEEPPSYHSILVENRSELPLEVEPIKLAVRLCLESHQAPPSDVRVLISTDSHIQELNRKFRDFDEPTDVLTFPEGEGSSGDIAIASRFACRQALLRNIAPQQEILLLAVHGTLHLLGFEDETEEGRTEMIERMYDVATTFGCAREEDWGSLLHGETKEGSPVGVAP